MYTAPLPSSSRGAPTATSFSSSPFRSVTEEMDDPNLPQEGPDTFNTLLSSSLGRGNGTHFLNCLDKISSYPILIWKYIESITFWLNQLSEQRKIQPYLSVGRHRSCPHSETGSTLEPPPAGSLCCRLSQYQLQTALPQNRTQSERKTMDKWHHIEYYNSMKNAS